MKRIGFVGAGAWGTALATVARRAGRDVVLWARSIEVAENINARHENPAYLPGAALDPAIRATNDLAEIGECEAVFLVTPAQHLGAVAARLAPHLAATAPVVICAKGIEQGSGKLLTAVVAEILPGRPAAVLSGPTFADEVARGLPTAVTLAAADAEIGRGLIEAIGTASFRPYLSDDPLGAEIGGAVKNVIAIGCGIVIGRKLGSNAHAALLTRGLAEVMRIGVALGAKPVTLMGLSGLGDLALTCGSAKSRNTSLGIALGEGRALRDVLARRRAVTEGVFSAGAVVALARRHGVDMPICDAVDMVLNRGGSIEGAIAGLLNRPFKIEFPAGA